MSDIKIYVEGKNDEQFLSDYLEVVLNFEVQDGVFCRGAIRVEIVVLRGWDKLRATKIQGDLQDNMEEEIKSLVIVDADTPSDAICEDVSFSYRFFSLYGGSDLFAYPDEQVRVSVFP